MGTGQSVPANSPSHTSSHPAGRTPATEHLGILLAALAAVLLALPGFAFTYAFDDYNFLGSAQHFHIGLLAPDPQSLFYRPISRELYFGFLTLISPQRALAG